MTPSIAAEARSSAAGPASARSHTGVKAFGLLMVAAALASAAIVPYGRALAGEGLSDLPIWGWIIAVAANLMLIGPVTALGLWLGPKVGLGAPRLYAWLDGRPDATRDLLRGALYAVGIGAVTGVVLLLGGLAFVPWLPEELAQAPVPTWWQALLASFSAGVTEELLLRLGLMTLLVWVTTKLVRRDGPSTRIVWGSIVVSALVFGAAHLPLAASLAPLTAMMVIRTLALNMLAGTVFGWTYWRFGLIAAMVAHASTDVVLHVLSPLLIGGQ